MRLSRSLLLAGALLGSGCYLSDDYTGGLPPEGAGGASGGGASGGGGLASGGKSGASGKSGSGGKAGSGGASGQGGKTGNSGSAGATSTGGSAGQGSNDAECPQLAAAHCQRVTSECSVPGAPGLVDCLQRIQAFCQAAQALPGAPSSLAPCISAINQGLAARGCEDLLDPFYACGLGGALPLGAGCSVDHQCQSGRCQRAGLPCGQCFPGAGEGEPCEAPFDCSPPLSCFGGLCTRRQDKGGKCANSSNCLTFYVCTDGLCQPRGLKGASCKNNPEFCDGSKGLYCGAFGTCKPMLSSDPDGSCSGSPPVLCTQGQVCIMDSGQSSGSCVSPAPDGSACSASLSGCAPPAVCQNGTCALVSTCP